MAWQAAQKVGGSFIPEGGTLVRYTLGAGIKSVPFPISGLADKCVQFAGDFSGGATVTAKWSNFPDAADESLNRAFVACRDITHTAISKVSADGEQIIENAMFIQFEQTGGSAAVEILLLVSNATRKG